MPYTVVFLWISAGLSQAPPPPPEQRSRALPAELGQLRDYGAARGLTFEPLASGATTSAGLVAYDAARVDRLEAELEQARTSLSALEEEAAGQRLSRVEAELLAHPHLPQAAFLMAECLALRAQVARQHDPALADELERSRAALEGPRAAAFGDAPASATTASPTIALRVAGLAALDELELDGASSARDVTLAPGLHHLRVWRAGRPIFATFSRVNVAQKQLSLPVPSLRQCGADDLGFVDARAMARGAAAPPGIECERWALARAEGTGIGFDRGCVVAERDRAGQHRC